MLRARRIFWLGLKEMLSLRHDAIMLGLLIYSFTLAILMESTGATGSVNNASIAFVDEDRSALSRQLAGAFLPPEFQPVQIIAAEEVDRAMDRGRFLFVVAVPPGFAADIRAGRSPELQVLIDATAMEQAGLGAGYIQAILAGEVADYAAQFDTGTRPAIDLVTHAAFNPTRDATRFQSVISLTGQVTVLTIILTGAAMIREREHGTVEHLLALPLTPFDIAAAKIWANAAVVLAAAAFALVVIIEGTLGVALSGARGLFLLATLIYLFSATALGVFLATLARSMAQFALLFFLTILPMQLLSGADTPIESQPPWLQPLTTLLPSRHYIATGQAILYKDAGLATVWPGLAAMALLGAGLLAVSLLMFRRSIGSAGGT